MIDGLRSRLGRKEERVSEEDAVLGQLAGYSVAGLPVVSSIYALARDVVTRGVPGDGVECGVYNGGTAGAMGYALAPAGRHVWLYDSFAGMPPTRDVDGEVAATLVGTYVGSVERVREALELASVPPTGATIREGLFEDTFREKLPERVAFLHIDADWYDSVTLALDTFYDRVSDGGIVVLDDFGHWEGCREAYYDFVARRGIKPLLERFGHTEAFWVKGRTHNRDVERPWTQ